MARTVIIAGGYGSGKSEIAVNLAYELKKSGREVTLADLDLINPYFAARDAAARLERDGIRVVAPSGAFAFTDLPSIPADLFYRLRQEEELIVDLAGDENGAAVLGYLQRSVRARPGYEYWLIVNPYRPFSADEAEMAALLAGLEDAGRMKFTGIVSNPNLLEDTTEEAIRDGHRQVEAYGRAFGLPVRRLVLTEPFYSRLYGEYGELLMRLNLFLRPAYLTR